MKKAYLFTDGAARGNPGPAGCGFVLADSDGHVVFEGHKYIGDATNNQAEYTALLEGLKKALELEFSEVDISLDSELVVRQILGEYKVKNEGLKLHFREATELLRKFGSYNIKHIPRERNKAADRLANRAIDEAI